MTKFSAKISTNIRLSVTFASCYWFSYVSEASELLENLGILTLLATWQFFPYFWEILFVSIREGYMYFIGTYLKIIY